MSPTKSSHHNNNNGQCKLEEASWICIRSSNGIAALDLARSLVSLAAVMRYLDWDSSTLQLWSVSRDDKMLHNARSYWRKTSIDTGMAALFEKECASCQNSLKANTTTHQFLDPSRKYRKAPPLHSSAACCLPSSTTSHFMQPSTDHSPREST